MSDCFGGLQALEKPVGLLRSPPYWLGEPMGKEY